MESSSSSSSSLIKTRLGTTVYLPTNEKSKKESNMTAPNENISSTSFSFTDVEQNETSNSSSILLNNNNNSNNINNNNVNLNNNNINITESLIVNSENSDSHVVKIQLSQKENLMIKNQNNSKVYIGLSDGCQIKNNNSVINISSSENQTTTTTTNTNNNNSVVDIKQDNTNNNFFINYLDKKTNEEMVQKSNQSDFSEVNSNYYYNYQMKSGQCSPSDTLDSGTCSDLENTPPTLQISKKIKSPTSFNHNHDNIIKDNLTSDHLDHHHSNKHEHHHLQEIINGNNITKINSEHISNHKRNVSLSDSDESQLSLSCDSLNGSDIIVNTMTVDDLTAIMSTITSASAASSTASSSLSSSSQQAITPPPPPLPMELFQSQESSPSSTPSSLIIDDSSCSSSTFTCLPDSLLKDIRERSQKKLNSYDIKGTIEIRSYLSRDELNLHNTQHENINQEIQNQQLLKFVESNQIYENDKYYKFHINENLNADTILENKPAKIEIDDAFAGYKDINSGTSTIRSSKGTIRGVKNRVRNGIATFLQMQHTNIKNYKEKDSGKVVLYTTSMGILRETYAKCVNLKQILRTLLIKFEERDVFMSSDYQLEIKDRMQSDKIFVPQLFVDGQYIGDADFVERLNETGELRRMLKPYKCLDPSYTCQLCGGYRLLPCSSCNGSKKSVHRNHFTAEFIALKCMNCDEVGLVKCYNC